LPMTCSNPVWWPCVVGSQTGQMLELGHPLVLRDRYTEAWPQTTCGALLLLQDQQSRPLAWALRDADGPVVARVIAAPASAAVDLLSVDWFVRRLTQAVELRRDHVDLEQTDAYRLVNGEGDGLSGLTLDCYAGHLLLQMYGHCWQPHRRALQEAIVRLLAPASLYEKFRPRQTRGLSREEQQDLCRLVHGQAPLSPLLVQENGLYFEVNLMAGLHSGLFMDQRDNRRDLMRRVAGRRVLNLFAYTGAFSVAAAAAGARQVTSVDLSAAALQQARQNFGHNRLNPKRHAFICADCFEILPQLGQQAERFDLVLMDPPSFSSTAKSRFTTTAGTVSLVRQVLDLLEPGGLLIASSNHQKTDLADYLKLLRRAALDAATGLRVIHCGGQSGDFPYSVSFPEGRYLKYVVAVKTAMV